MNHCHYQNCFYKTYVGENYCDQHVCQKKKCPRGIMNYAIPFCAYHYQKFKDVTDSQSYSNENIYHPSTGATYRMNPRYRPQTPPMHQKYQSYVPANKTKNNKPDGQKVRRIIIIEEYLQP